MEDRSSRDEMGLARFDQWGHVQFPVAYDGPAKTFVFALTPKFSMHSFSAALEPLRIANQLTGKQLYHWETRTIDGNPATASNGLSVSSDGVFDTLPKDSILLACSGDNAKQNIPQKLTGFLRSAWRRGHFVGGVCTGAYALLDAGILKGHEFTLHWECQPSFAEDNPTLIPSSAAFVKDKRLITCGGGVASTDMVLHLIETDFGFELRHVVADMCLQIHVRGQSDLQRSPVAKAYGLRNANITKAIRYLEDNLQSDLSVEEWVDSLGISRRQLERLFKRYTGFSPRRFATNFRIEHAYALLLGTDLAIGDVAMCVGMSPSNFSGLFKRRYGVNPNEVNRKKLAAK